MADQGRTQRSVVTVAGAALVLMISGCTQTSPTPSSAASGSPGATAPESSASASVGPTAGWIATGDLGEARPDHTATLLQDGRVLMAGGFDPTFGDVFGFVASTQLYNTATGVWTMTGALQEGRYAHTATLLQDGRVLVTGGVGGNGRLASAELYDPDAGTWAATGSMQEARVSHTATLLPDGQVLVAGFFDGSSDGVRSLASAELFDPASGLWTPTASMAQARGLHTATLLKDGRVLVAGGTGDNSTSGELYDPTTQRWTATRPMVEGRGGHTATLLGNGMVLIVGSGGETAQLYDPSSDAWGLTGAPSGTGIDNATVLLADGRVLVTGGYNSNGDGLADAQLYDPISRTWTATASMLEGRVYHSATLLPDGTVLVAGGSKTIYADSLEELVLSAELYDPGSEEAT